MFYAKIKSLPRKLRDKAVEQTLKELGLTAFRTLPPASLSSGQKRLLAVAIAVLANPPVLLLDDPTAKLDTDARALVWTALQKLAHTSKKCAIVLSTQSIEEAEVMAIRAGHVDARGTFSCIGSSKAIKENHSRGCEIQLKLRKATTEDIAAILSRCKFGVELDDHINLKHAVAKAKHANFNSDILHEIREDGLGADLWIEARANKGNVTLHNLVEYLFIHSNAFNTIDKLTSVFTRVEVVEQCADYYKLKLPSGSVGGTFIQL